MPLRIRLQPTNSVETPDPAYVRMFCDVNQVPKLKDSDGVVVDLTGMVGPAGGDLAGEYPDPDVAVTRALKTTGAAVSTSAAAPPASGDVITATSSVAATWQPLVGLTPSGSAGGDLIGNYPNPTVQRANGLRSATTIVDGSSATAPTAGQRATATSDSTFEWQDPAPVTPTGAAGGDLLGFYPHPGVRTTPSLKTATANVVTSLSPAPSGPQLLVATSPMVAVWGSPSTDISGAWNSPVVDQARGLKTATTTVNISASAAPIAGRALRATSDSTATWQALDRYVRNSVWDPPLSADAADQEFDVDPFAAGTWRAVATNTTSTVYTRTGDVDITSSPVAGTYRSTLAGSIVFVQTPPGQSTTLITTNPVSGATSGDQLWMCGLGGVNDIDPSASGSFFGMFAMTTSAGNPDKNNRAQIGLTNPDNLGVSNDIVAGVTSGGVFTITESFVSNSQGVTGMPGFFIRKGSSQQSGSGASSITFGTFSPTGAIGSFSTLGTSFSGTWDWVGFGINATASSTWGPAVWGGGGIIALHFMRRKLGATDGLWG